MLRSPGGDRRMRLEHHVAVSTVISAALFAVLKSWQVAVSSFLAGVFIDLDHFLDVFVEYKTGFTLREFFDICHNGRLERLRLVLHSWELVPLLAAATLVSGSNPWVMGIAFGIAQHLVCDQFYNRPVPLAYFMIWRWRQGFLPDKMFNEFGKGAATVGQESTDVQGNN